MCTHTICTSDAVHHFLRLGRFFCSLGSSSTDSFWGTYNITYNNTNDDVAADADADAGADVVLPRGAAPYNP